MQEAQYWDRVHREKEPDRVSWYQAVPELSLALIAEADLAPTAAILDVGGGASGLAAGLLAAGYTDVTVADISERALERARRALDAAADRVTWVSADVRTHHFGRRFDLWHDRAVFHFMTTADDRAGYLEVLSRTLRPGGQLVLAGFGPGGPQSCSGLPVVRYSAAELESVLGPEYTLESAHTEHHRTPNGAAQQFTFTRFHRLDAGPGADSRQARENPPKRAESR